MEYSHSNDSYCGGDETGRWAPNDRGKEPAFGLKAQAIQHAKSSGQGEEYGGCDSDGHTSESCKCLRL